MQIPKDLHKRITAKYGTVIDLRANPEVLQELFTEIRARVQPGPAEPQRAPEGSPFGVSWMDSWVAHWVVNEKILTAQARDAEFASVLKGLVDLKFNERLIEIRQFIREFPHFAEAPDGGPPEPGTPPAGPSSFVPPDGGPPEPGAPPPAGPARFEPPDGGTPEPGVPPTGPDAGFLRDNPWILYWFVSVKAPQILEMIDAHLTRRMNDARGGATSG